MSNEALQGLTAITDRKSDGSKIMGAHHGTESGACEIRDGRCQNIDDAVHGIGAMHDAAGAAQHLDRCGLSGIGFEEFVDVAEAGGSKREAILEE